jgi:hypothetical protein
LIAIDVNMKLIVIILTSLTFLHDIGMCSGLELKVIANVDRQAEILDLRKNESPVEKSEHLSLVIRCVLVNHGRKDVLVATGVKSIRIDHSGFFRLRLIETVVENIDCKPSTTDLNLVNLRPGEATALPLIIESVANKNDIPKIVTVTYYINNGFGVFYEDLWTGEIKKEAEVGKGLR